MRGAESAIGSQRAAVLLALALVFFSVSSPARAVAGAPRLRLSVPHPLALDLAALPPEPASSDPWENARAREWDLVRGLPPGQEVQASHRLNWGRVGTAIFYRRTPVGWRDDLSTAVATAQFRPVPHLEVAGTVAGLSRPAWYEDRATLALNGRWWLTDRGSLGGEYAVNQGEGHPSAWALDAESSGDNLFLRLEYDSAEKGFIPHPDLPRQAGYIPGGQRWSLDAEGSAGPAVLAGGLEVQEGGSGDRQTKRYTQVVLALPGAVGRLEVGLGMELLDLDQLQADGRFFCTSSTRKYGLDFRWQPGGGVILNGGYTLTVDGLQHQPLFGQAGASLSWPVQEDLAFTASLSTRLDFSADGGGRWQTEGAEAQLAVRF